MVDNAAEKFNFLYEKFIKNKGGKVYLSLVPDKNLFLAEKNGYLAIDYEKFAEDFEKNVERVKKDVSEFIKAHAPEGCPYVYISSCQNKGMPVITIKGVLVSCTASVPSANQFLSPVYLGVWNFLKFRTQFIQSSVCICKITAISQVPVSTIMSLPD